MDKEPKEVINEREEEKKKKNLPLIVMEIKNYN